VVEEGYTEDFRGLFQSFCYVQVLIRTAQTEAPPPPVAAPDELGAEASGEGKIRLTWKTVEGAGEYKVYSSFNTPNSFTFRAAVKSADYTASGLQAGAVYYFRVSAVAGGEEGPMSKSARAQVAASAAVGAPTGLSASALSPARITVTWNGVSGAALYYIYRTTGANSAGLIVDYTTGTSYTDTGLAGNTTYYYRVSAYKNGAETEKSAAATVTTLLPQPPTGLSVTDVSGNYIGLSWEASEGAAAYNVYRASASGSYTKIAQPAPLAFTDTGLSTGTTYLLPCECRGQRW